MTHARHAQVIVEDAIAEAHRRHGPEALAPMLGYLSHAQVSRVQARVTDGISTYLESYAADRLVHLATHLPQIAHAIQTATAHHHPAGPLEHTLDKLTVELGRDVATVAQARADNHLTPDELDQISERLNRTQALIDEVRIGTVALRERWKTAAKARGQA